jgi:hypothetical protein
MPRYVALDSLQQLAVVKVSDDLGAVPGKKIVTSCAQVVLNWQLPNGKRAHNVMYGKFSGPFALTVADANAIYLGLSTGTQATALLTHFSPTTQMQSVDLRNVDVKDQPLIVGTVTSRPGTAATPSQAGEMAEVITLRTAIAGPGGRGRIYLPALCNADWNAGDLMGASAVADINTWAGTIASVLTGRGLQFVLGLAARVAYTSPITGTPHEARASVGAPITSAALRDNHWDTQRRRGLK